MAGQEVGDKRNLNRSAIDKVCDRDSHQGVIAAVGDCAGEINQPVFADSAGALHEERDARETDFRVHTLIAAALAVRVVLVDHAGVTCGGADRAIRTDILRAYDVRDDGRIKI